MLSVACRCTPLYPAGSKSGGAMYLPHTSVAPPICQSQDILNNQCNLKIYEKPRVCHRSRLYSCQSYTLTRALLVYSRCQILPIYSLSVCVLTTQYDSIALFERTIMKYERSTIIGCEWVVYIIIIIIIIIRVFIVRLLQI